LFLSNHLHSIQCVRWWLSFLIFVCLAAPARAAGLAPDNLLLLVNKNVPEGQGLAEHYSRARHIPAGRILALDLPNGDELSFEQYESNVVPAIRDFIRQQRIQAKVNCLVTFYGVPLKIQARPKTASNQKELAELNQLLSASAAELLPTVKRAESLASGLDASFVPLPGDDIDALARRVDHAGDFVRARIEKVSDASRHDDLIRQFNQVIGEFAETRADEPSDATTAPATAPTTAPATAPTNTQRLMLLEARRYDPAARSELRELARSQLSLFRAARLISAQRDYLLPSDTDAALDNELPLLWWSFYRRMRWEPNPLNYKYLSARTPPVLMVMRLDAPKPQQVQSIIDASIAAEVSGLAGNVVLDAGGAAALDPSGKNPLYHAYDRSIIQLAALLKTTTKLPVIIDTRQALLPPNAAQDVALYCGWYSPGKYVPCIKPAPGAIGYHIASYEMTSLHNENAGWCRGLLNDGIAATLGPVQEPFLHAFPLPDEFFPLLLTGKLTLAEVYWRTNPLVSWRMAAIGDPLYNPFKNAPALPLQDLPAALKAVATTPTTQP
jgi:uncharacterized protein (TIGR03790 family)